MKTIRQNIKLITFIGIAVFLGACGVKESDSASDEQSLHSLSGILLSAEPQGALALGKFKETAQSGDAVVVTGQIGGKFKPFIKGYAGFVLSDEEVLFCNEMDDDHCATPWDACCEDIDKLKANRATVQFVDAEGSPIIGGIKGVDGLSELEKVIVVGSVAPQSNENNLVINATGLYRVQ